MKKKSFIWKTTLVPRVKHVKHHVCAYMATRSRIRRGASVSPTPGSWRLNHVTESKATSTRCSQDRGSQKIDCFTEKKNTTRLRSFNVESDCSSHFVCFRTVSGTVSTSDSRLRRRTGSKPTEADAYVRTLLNVLSSAQHQEARGFLPHLSASSFLTRHEGTKTPGKHHINGRNLILNDAVEEPIHTELKYRRHCPPPGRPSLVDISG